MQCTIEKTNKNKYKIKTTKLQYITSVSPETLEWKYVGEAGVEIKARNSHGMGIIGS